MTRDTDTRSVTEWTYESVEYSDGYIHTVFNPHGIAICDRSDEGTARRLVEIKNKESRT